LEVPILHNSIEGLARPDKVEANDYESGDVFDDPAIYLAALEEVSMWEEGELTIEEPKVDLDNLSKEERREIVKLFETKNELFTRKLDKLTQTNMIQHEIDT
ncbi:18470_t:CDS:2, partial [Acaulospora morrowiae]